MISYAKTNRFHVKEIDKQNVTVEEEKKISLTIYIISNKKWKVNTNNISSFFTISIYNSIFTYYEKYKRFINFNI